MIVVISDGENKCTPPPCEVAKDVRAQRPGVKISTVGFRANDEALECVARSTKGTYVTADNADQLGARLVAVLDPEAAATQLSPQGAHGISLGMSIAEATKQAEGFPSEGSTRTESGETIVTITWRDCTWTFTDDELTSIEPKGDAAATIDGVRVGDAIGTATQFYGEPVVRESGDGLSQGQKEYTYPAVAGDTGEDGPTGWRIVADSADRIVTITLCRCAPEKWRSAQIEAEEGGSLTIGGDEIDAQSGMTESDLVDLLGEPEERRDEASCDGPLVNGDPIPLVSLRWGDLTIWLLREDLSGGSGPGYAAGSVVGWEVGPPSGSSVVPKVSGPENLQIGDPLSTLREIYGDNSDEVDGWWDLRGVSEEGGVRSFYVRREDQTLAQFVLDDADRVASMSSGWSCS